MTCLRPNRLPRHPRRRQGAPARQANIPSRSVTNESQSHNVMRPLSSEALAEEGSSRLASGLAALPPKSEVIFARTLRP